MEMIFIRKAVALFLLLLLASCELTRTLWNPSYNEKIQQFLISQDGRYVVFLGKKYHYILSDNNDIVKNLLLSPFRKYIFVASEETNLKLSQSNEIEANIVIKSKTRGALDPKIQSHFERFGFRFDDHNDLVLAIKMRGTRYYSPENIYHNSGFLNGIYDIKIYENISAFKRIEKAALTPITLTLDAGLFIGTILLFPFGN